MRRIVIVLLGLTLPAVELIAQRGARPASGFWYAAGIAPAWTRVTCQICAGARKTGLSAFIGLGGSAGRALRVGGELAGWHQGDPGITQTMMSIGAAAYWYPSGQRRIYLRGGVALLMHRASDGTDVVTSSGIGPQLGIGYEHATSARWLVAPFVHYSVGVFGGDVKFNGAQAANSATVSFLQVGVSFTRR